MNTRKTPSLDDLEPDQRAAVIAFRDEHGRTWKSQLNTHWFDGTDANFTGGRFLRQVRNQFGPQWLFRLVGEN